MTRADTHLLKAWEPLSARPFVTRLRRRSYRLRRRAQSFAESFADRLRPANVDSRDPGRLAAAMSVSSTLFALLVVLFALLVADLYGPLARDALRAMGFAV
ncbi:MAG TPA: hypothetical protein VGN33_06425 [Leifsonia sp.]|jgi:hypothetical protein|nr:hypothetical protein [Leifsonia sp.]